MRATAVTQTPVDTNALPIPFKPQYTIVAANPGDTPLDLQSTNDDPANPGNPEVANWADIGTVPANGFIELTLNNQWIRVETAATLYLLGN